MISHNDAYLIYMDYLDIFVFKDREYSEEDAIKDIIKIMPVYSGVSNLIKYIKNNEEIIGMYDCLYPNEMNIEDYIKETKEYKKGFSKALLLNPR